MTLYMYGAMERDYIWKKTKVWWVMSAFYVEHVIYYTLHGITQTLETLSTDVFEPRTPSGSQNLFFGMRYPLLGQLTNAKTRAFQLIQGVDNALKTITVAF